MSFDYQGLAQQFVSVYYNQFSTDRTQLASLYRDTSMLTFEQTQVQGTQAIVEKLNGLGFQKVQHEISTLDAQPGTPGSRDVIVLVTGKLVFDEETPKGYSQMFHLLPEGETYYVYNDIFRLVY